MCSFSGSIEAHEEEKNLHPIITYFLSYFGFYGFICYIKVVIMLLVNYFMTS